MNKSNNIEDLITRLKSGEYDGADIMQAWLLLGEVASMQKVISKGVYYTLDEIIEHDKRTKIKTLVMLRERMMTNIPYTHTQWTMEVVEGMMKELARV